MCFGEEDHRRKNNRREIKSLGRLGYKVAGVVPGQHPIDRSHMQFYSIQDHFKTHIAMVAASLEDGVLYFQSVLTNTFWHKRPSHTAQAPDFEQGMMNLFEFMTYPWKLTLMHGFQLPRIVLQIYTNRDHRSSRERPLASDILLSVWKHLADQNVRSLKGVLFQTVEEPGVRAARESVYQNLDKPLSERVVLDRNSEYPNERHEFHKVHDDTKLGRCVRTMAKEYIEMKEYRFEVDSIEFIPQDRRGNNFHLMVWLHRAR